MNSDPGTSGLSTSFALFARSGDRFALLVAAVLAALLVMLAIEPWPAGVFQDDGIYVVLARSLATGEGYRFLNLPGAPDATHYPPLYPAFLAALWKLAPDFPRNVTVFKFANAGLLAVATAFAFVFMRRRAKLGVAAAFVTAIAFTACAPTILLAVMVLSEPLFLALLLPTLLVTERVVDQGGVRHAVASGVLVSLLTLARTLGGVALPAAWLVLAFRRRWKELAVMVLVPVVILAPWQWWVATHGAEVPPVFQGKYGSYLGWLTGAVGQEGPAWVVRVAWHNLGMLAAQGWASTATESFAAPLRWTVTLCTVGLLAFGWYRLLRCAPVSALFLLASCGIVVVWPFTPARLTWSLWPLVGCCFALAMSAVWRHGRSHAATLRERILAPSLSPGWRAARVALLLIATLLGAGYGTYNWLGASRGWWTQVQGSVANRARPVAEWVMANTRPDDVIATDDDVLIHLYTGRPTVPTGAFTAQEHLDGQTPAFAVERLREILATYDVDYVAATTDYGTYAARGLIQSDPPQLRIVQVLPQGAIYAPMATR